MRPVMSDHYLTEREVRMSARLVIADYGADAATLARMRVHEMFELSDGAGAVAWARILKAVQEIQQREFKPS